MENQLQKGQLKSGQKQKRRVNSQIFNKKQERNFKQVLICKTDRQEIPSGEQQQNKITIQLPNYSKTKSSIQHTENKDQASKTDRDISQVNDRKKKDLQDLPNQKLEKAEVQKNGTAQVQKKKRTSSIKGNIRQSNLQTQKNINNDNLKRNNKNLAVKKNKIPLMKKTLTIKKNFDQKTGKNKGKQMGSKSIDLNSKNDQNYQEYTLQTETSDGTKNLTEQSLENLIQISPLQTSRVLETVGNHLQIAIEDFQIDSQANAFKPRTTFCSPNVLSPKNTTFQFSTQAADQRKFQSPLFTNRDLQKQEIRLDFKYELSKVNHLRQTTLNCCNGLQKQKHDLQSQGEDLDQSFNRKDENWEILQHFQRYIIPLITKVRNEVGYKSISTGVKNEYIYHKILKSQQK